MIKLRYLILSLSYPYIRCLSHSTSVIDYSEYYDISNYQPLLINENFDYDNNNNIISSAKYATIINNNDARSSVNRNKNNDLYESSGENNLITDDDEYIYSTNLRTNRVYKPNANGERKKFLINNNNDDDEDGSMFKFSGSGELNPGPSNLPDNGNISENTRNRNKNIIQNNNNFDFFEKTKSSNYDYNYRNRGEKFFNQLVPNNDMNRIRNQNSPSKATVITDDSDLDYGSSIGGSGDGYLPNSYSKDTGTDQNNNNNFIFNEDIQKQLDAQKNYDYIENLETDVFQNNNMDDGTGIVVEDYGEEVEIGVDPNLGDIEGFIEESKSRTHGFDDQIAPTKSDSSADNDNNQIQNINPLYKQTELLDYIEPPSQLEVLMSKIGISSEFYSSNYFILALFIGLIIGLLLIALVIYCIYSNIKKNRVQNKTHANIAGFGVNRNYNNVSSNSQFISVMDKGMSYNDKEYDSASYLIQKNNQLPIQDGQVVLGQQEYFA